MGRNFLLLIFVLSFSWGGEQFVFTARTVSKNHLTTYDNLTISPLMKKRTEYGDMSCDLMINPSGINDTYSFLKEHKYMVAECFLGEKTRVYDYGEQHLLAGSYQTDVTVLPVYFTVDFKEDFVTLILLDQ